MTPKPGEDGNKPSCVGGKSEPSGGEVNRPPPRESEDNRKLVQIGSRFFSKEVTTRKKFQFGVELGKSPSGIRAKSLSELSSEKERVYKPVNPEFPTCPDESE